MKMGLFNRCSFHTMSALMMDHGFFNQEELQIDQASQ